MAKPRTKLDLVFTASTLIHTFLFYFCLIQLLVCINEIKYTLDYVPPRMGIPKGEQRGALAPSWPFDIFVVVVVKKVAGRKFLRVTHPKMECFANHL